jgi:uncharacterized coiled-coil protein SlyX|uniref:Uncharacterized protein n=1 Tax=Desulfomonile tiedjei TaxID=2358 RepID=A0A7C4AQH0_9BACT
MAFMVEMEKKWLDERFSHLATALDHIRQSIDELKDNQIRCVNRCSSEMRQVYERLRDVENRQAARNGAHEHERDARELRNIGWQMVIALATAASAIGAFLGYFVWRLP